MAKQAGKSQGKFNIMKQAIAARAKAYSRCGNREKTIQRLAELRIKIDAAIKKERSSDQ